ncbi:LAETG motif-containing sortase-dependent surface protein [Streptomyces sp. NPDC047886]|uniref:LAETG motif-containing sortase-dependent surface protein n=1 Tax=Streptomyces sp. NPDC047886 TaxID=3365490 RepID=UPI003718AB49
MTPFIRRRRGSAALLTSLAAGAATVALSAAPAFAHIPTWSVTCSEVRIELTRYSADVTNEVTVTVDGEDLLPTERFGAEFRRTLELPRHDKEIAVRLVIKDGSPGGHFSRDETRTAPVCETTTPTPTPSPTPPGPAPTPTGSTAPSPTPTFTPTPTPTPSDVPSSAAPAPQGPDLADTGASGATPLVGAAAAAAVVVGGGVLWAVRRRRPAQD